MESEPTPQQNSEAVGGSSKAMPANDLLLINADIRQMSERLNVPRSIMEVADKLFLNIHREKKLKARSNTAIIAACLYIGCRQEGLARSFKEICAVSNVTKKDISHCYKVISEDLDMTLEHTPAANFVLRYSTKLNLPAMVQSAAALLSNAAEKMDIFQPRSPISIASAAIYMASQVSIVKRSAKEICDVTLASQSALRESYKLMHSHAEQLLPNDVEFCAQIKKLPPQ